MLLLVSASSDSLLTAEHPAKCWYTPFLFAGVSSGLNIDEESHIHHQRSGHVDAPCSTPWP